VKYSSIQQDQMLARLNKIAEALDEIYAFHDAEGHHKEEIAVHVLQIACGRIFEITPPEDNPSQKIFEVHYLVGQKMGFFEEDSETISLPDLSQDKKLH